MNTGNGGKRRTFEQDNDRNQKVINPNQMEICKLKADEQFKYLFHPGNIKSLTKPKKKDGEIMCMRYHTLGYCFKDCKYHKGHGNLNEEETQDMATFLTNAREVRAAFTNRRKRNRNGENNGGETPTPNTPTNLIGNQC